jgi:2-furoate---CoA ligase
MLDLGTTFLASVERSPDAVAIVDGDTRLTYARWMERVGAVAGGLAQLGLKHGDHLALVLQNRWEAATLHWACQLLGVIVTPLNWRLKADEVDYCVDNAEARAVIYEALTAEAVEGSTACRNLPRIAVGDAGGAYRCD